MHRPNHHEPAVKAIWSPGWHRLDPSLRVGQTGKFWFQRQALSDEKRDGLLATLVFMNRLEGGEVRPEIRSATVAGLEHPVLGTLRAIDTAGLDYVFVTADGRDIAVNAEEEPGMAYDADAMMVTDWTVEVLLVDVSGPEEDQA